MKNFSCCKLAFSMGVYVALLCGTVANLAFAYEFDKRGVPQDEPIDVCALEPIACESLGVVDFADKNTSSDGWYGRVGVNIERGENALVITSEDSDPYFHTPVLDALFPKETLDKTVGKVIVKARIRRQDAGAGQIFFITRVANQGFEEARSTHFTLKNDNEFHDYYVPLDSEAPLLQLRFDIGDDKGKAELARVELLKVVYKPLKYGAHTVDDGVLNYSLINNSDDQINVELKRFGVHPEKSTSVANVQVDDKALDSVYFPQKKTFEEIEVVANIQGNEDKVARRFFAFNPKIADSELEENVPTIKSGSVQVRFAPDASGAEILRNGKRVAVICPLLCEEGDGSAILPDKTDYFAEIKVKVNDANNAPNTRLIPVLRSIGDDAKEAEFNICAIPVDEARAKLDKAAKGAKLTANDVDRVVEPSSIVGSLKFRLDGDILSFDYDSPRDIHAPVLRALGEMEQAILSGSEYLQKGEHSSSTADIATPEHIRYAQPVDWTTAPFASVVTNLGSVSLLYDNPKNQSIFAVPDFIDGVKDSSRINIVARQGSGKIRFAEPLEPIENAILWSVKTRGLPDVPTPPRTGKEEEQFILKGLTDSYVKTPSGWRHAVSFPDPPYTNFPPAWGCDYISTIWELTGKLPETKGFSLGGGHMRYYDGALMMGKGELLAASMKNQIQQYAQGQAADGSFRYSGKYAWGGDSDTASGYCGNFLFSLMENWRVTKDPLALETAVKGLDFVNTLKTPAGAQTWELSVHTPDIMGASRCCMANVLCYEATGEKKYLDAAVRWALTGIPFVYLWEDPELTPGKQPMMRYATIAVFGATSWVAPNWMGRPVQWCGLDYARACLMLAKHDNTLDWRKIGVGIVASAECQLVENEPGMNGLLPDSFQIKTQKKYLCNINPTAVSMMRRVIDGNPTCGSVVDCGEYRVLSPFPARVENNVVKINAEKGLEYQVLINGKEVRTIKSQGEDTLTF